MITYDNCPYEQRGTLKVFLLPWGHTYKEFLAVWNGWKEEYYLKNLDNHAIIDFEHNPDWAKCDDK
jgi:hypothetical protein